MRRQLEYKQPCVAVRKLAVPPAYTSCVARAVVIPRAKSPVTKNAVSGMDIQRNADVNGAVTFSGGAFFVLAREG